MGLLFSEGNRVPEFLLPRLGGTAVRLADMHLRPTVFYMWAPWHPSRDGLKALQDFHAVNSFRVNVIAVSFDVKGPVETAQLVRKLGLTYTILLDNACILSRLWGVRQLPWVIVVDGDGFVERIGTEVAPKILQAAFTAEQSAKRTRIFEPVRGRGSDTRVEILLQHVANCLGRGRQAEAMESIQAALKLDPDNQIIARQIPLIEAQA
jgi:peroxiredoxin